MASLTPYDGPSPDDVAQYRKLAMALAGNATSAEPVQHWTQGLARVLQGGVSGMYADQAREGEKAGTAGIINMLQGQTNPTPVQLLSNPWTREAGMKTLVQNAKGPEFGRQGTIVQGNDANGNPKFYAVQFNDRGEIKYHPLNIPGGGSANGVTTTGENGQQTSIRLQPAKGTKQIGTDVVDVATGQPIRDATRAIAGKERAEEIGKAGGKAAADLQRVVDNSQSVLDTIAKIKDHPGLAGNFGMSGMLPNMPGGKSADARVLMDQLRGKAFLEAFNSLRGGGQITEVEGQKATDAILRASQAQSVDSYKKALADFEDVVKVGVERARRNSGLGAADTPPLTAPNGNVPLPPQNTGPSGWGFKRLD